MFFCCCWLKLLGSCLQSHSLGNEKPIAKGNAHVSSLREMQTSQLPVLCDRGGQPGRKSPQADISHEQKQPRNSVIVPSAISGQVCESVSGNLSFFLGGFQQDIVFWLQLHSRKSLRNLNGLCPKGISILWKTKIKPWGFLWPSNAKVTQGSSVLPHLSRSSHGKPGLLYSLV